MIPARKSAAFIRWFSRHVEKRVHRDLQRVQIRGLDAWQAAVAAHPVLLVSNHVSWWDVMLGTYFVHRVIPGCDAFGMMDAANLRGRPFFAKIGVFGVERGARGQGLGVESLRYAQGLLDRPGRHVWVFPQGDERPSTLRPLGFRKGAAVIAQAVPEAVVVPLAFRYELMKTDKPYAFLSVGDPVPRGADVAATRDAMEAAVLTELDRIDRHLCVARDPEFVTHCQAPPDRMGVLAERMLAWRHRKARAERALPKA
ncbi:MAG: lysophospholipid acyltransferase family protein [Myxococcales bacterium]|nr:lysophospholipid acyltransferase family protein [Myxococcales bacterium]MCB9523424.1 1-acyl-sn-glycerol-3-phosphate acyltransferase [Myxococcales bacterium]